MALNATVGRKGGSIAKTDVTATVIADKGIRASRSRRRSSLSPRTVSPASRRTSSPRWRSEAEKGCPVSNALRGSLQIELEAKAV